MSRLLVCLALCVVAVAANSDIPRPLDKFTQNATFGQNVGEMLDDGREDMARLITTRFVRNTVFRYIAPTANSVSLAVQQELADNAAFQKWATEEDIAYEFTNNFWELIVPSCVVEVCAPFDARVHLKFEAFKQRRDEKVFFAEVLDVVKDMIVSSTTQFHALTRDFFEYAAEVHDCPCRAWTRAHATRVDHLSRYLSMLQFVNASVDWDAEEDAFVDGPKNFVEFAEAVVQHDLVGALDARFQTYAEHHEELGAVMQRPILPTNAADIERHLQSIGNRLMSLRALKVAITYNNILSRLPGYDATTKSFARESLEAAAIMARDRLLRSSDGTTHAMTSLVDEVARRMKDLDRIASSPTLPPNWDRYRVRMKTDPSRLDTLTRYEAYVESTHSSSREAITAVLANFHGGESVDSLLTGLRDRNDFHVADHWWTSVLNPEVAPISEITAAELLVWEARFVVRDLADVDAYVEFVRADLVMVTTLVSDLAVVKRVVDESPDVFDQTSEADYVALDAIIRMIENEIEVVQTHKAEECTNDACRSVSTSKVLGLAQWEGQREDVVGLA